MPMNLTFEIRPERPNSFPELTARVRAIGGEVRAEIEGLIQEAVHKGQLVAESEAPRGPTRFRRDGVPIRDAIRATENRYAPGGAGGGGFYEADLYASEAASPHLRWVFEGTADEGRGLIRPARGNVLALQKEGEEIHYREWVHGQKPQTLWWEHAREEVERTLEDGIQRIK